MSKGSSTIIWLYVSYIPFFCDYSPIYIQPATHGDNSSPRCTVRVSLCQANTCSRVEVEDVLAYLLIKTKDNISNDTRQKLAASLQFQLSTHTQHSKGSGPTNAHQDKINGLTP
jgi:hypothetical protein